MYVELEPILAIAAGIGVLVFPRMLNYIVGIYLIIIGAVQLLN